MIHLIFCHNLNFPFKTQNNLLIELSLGVLLLIRRRHCEKYSRLPSFFHSVSLVTMSASSFFITAVTSLTA
jgi:hypothetical protein